MSYIIRISIAILLMAFNVNQALARFKTFDDCDISYDIYNNDILVSKDGTYESTIELKITLLKEQARAMAAKYSIYYNSTIEEFKLIEAKTIINQDSYQVTKVMVENKPIASNRQGFDLVNQVSISFPKPEVGSSIYLKYKIKTNFVVMDNQFFDSYFFGPGGYWKNCRLTINSAIPLRYKINDPNQDLSIKEIHNKENSEYISGIEVKLKNPLTTDTTSEARDSELGYNHMPYLSVSSLDSWNQFATNISVQYNKVLDQELPKEFLDIVKDVATKKSMVDKLNLITTMLNDKVEYFGNWGTLRGRYIPQDFQKVIEKQSGDCKDFAALTTKILRMLGYKADVAFVSRGEGKLDFANLALPGFYFNHAIIHVEDSDGKKYWIDPTNIVSMADGIFPDIAGKYSIVLNSESNLEKIPVVDYNHAKSYNEEIIHDKIIEQKIKLSGENALIFTAGGLYLSPEQIIDFVYNTMGIGYIADKNRTDFKVSSPLTSRILEPIDLFVKYKDPDLFTNTNLGYAFPLGTFYGVGGIRSIDPEKDVNDLYIGYPGTFERKFIIKGMKAVSPEKLDFSFNSDYISISRKCSMQDKDILILEKLIIKQSWIQRKDFQLDSFKELQSVIKRKYLNNIVVFSPFKSNKPG